MVSQTVRNSQVAKTSDARPLKDFLPPWNPPQPAFDEPGVEEVVSDGSGP